MYKKMKDEEIDFVVGGLATPIVKDNFIDKNVNSISKKKNNVSDSDENVLAHKQNV